MKDKQIISIDWSNGEDHTVVSSICGNCGYVLESKLFIDLNEKLNSNIYKTCPQCGVEFNKHVIIE
jgi:predicted Zn-ribbon and HTH transcriptional regulator